MKKIMPNYGEKEFYYHFFNTAIVKLDSDKYPVDPNSYLYAVRYFTYDQKKDYWDKKKGLNREIQKNVLHKLVLDRIIYGIIGV